MSKFLELSALATKYSRAIFDNKAKCQRAAALLMRDYAEYLGCPVENVDFLGLDGDLRPTTQVVPFSGIVPMVLDGKAFWHFCARIRFDGADPNAYAHELLKISLRYEDGHLTACEGDKEFKAESSELATLLPLFDHLYESSRVGFQRPLAKQASRIGFMG